MLRTTFIAAALAATGTFALAESHAMGDAAAGEDLFGRCKSCHAIESPEETIVRGGKVGPNLYGVIGRTAGTEESFGKKYGDDLKAAGEAGLVWDQENLAEYVADPKAFLAKTLDNSKVRSKMAFKLADGGADVAAYLATFSEDGGS